MLALNIVPFNANVIMAYQPKDPTEPYLYSPHQPLEILDYQNMINMSTKNNTELKAILDEIYIERPGCQPSGLELIMETYVSTFK